MLHDVVIVGAGPVGSSLALALADADLDVVVLDARAPGESPRSDRSLALTHGARLIFERLGVWPTLAAAEGAVTPIVEVDISQAGGFGVTRLHASELALPALGYVVSYRALQSALDTALARTKIALRYGMAVASVDATRAYAVVQLKDTTADAITARIVAVADGSGAAVSGIARRHYEYDQVALVSKLWLATEPDRTAYERFTRHGAIALLPEGDHYALIWTMTAQRAAMLSRAADAEFLSELSHNFGPRVSGFVRIDDRRAFPLVLEYARDITGPRLVLLGNAAQTLHPVAAQGFNLGLRDAYELARTVLDTPRDAIGDASMLDRYASARRRDRGAGILFTHGLVRAFGNDVPLVHWSRGLALALLDALPPAKRAFTRTMLFGAGNL